MGSRSSKDERIAKAKELREAGLSYEQIGKNLGVSKTTAWELVNDI